MSNLDAVHSGHIPKERLITDSERHRALFGSVVGSTIEWYDYFLYGTMSSIVFAKLFFPATDALTSQLLALASFALAFLIRPLGGIIFSHIGDRIGRKKTLVITLSLMGVSTVLMGLLPTYAQLGVWAPILLILLRLMQGLALGGEWGGGVLLAVEYSPREHRGLYGAVPQTGAVLGLALGNIITSALNSSMSPQAFLSYGWRIPFVASVALVVLGMWLRNRVDETPSFKKILASEAATKVPLAETLKHHWREVLIAVGTKVIETSTFFLYATFSIAYMMNLGFQQSQVLNIVLVCALLAFPSMLYFGRLSDRIGRKKVFVGGTIAFMIWVMPYFWLLNQRSLPAAMLAIAVGFTLIWSTYGAMIGTLLAEAFPASVRYTGMSLGYQIGAALVGGPMPLIATALVAHYGGSYVPVGMFLMGCGLVSLIAVGLTRDRSGKELDD
ncbi:MHS family MFS transporter [Burkholderia pyrrocinia]|uniref:MFS transporter n=1 Tax=Burkholderia pyrrocinia TaxID=60550 RepID=UPI000502230B|nr:MFS transporter [Burkholderia pyrrocinia]KFL50020.1 major facilitator transporter [Burkholderia pyrrocinia]UOB60174.1 MHS family MFS transporter [Burkholderia pyrrocinia]